MIRNKAGQVVTAQLNALADGTPVTTGTTDILVVKDGIGSDGLGLIVHTGDGLWTYFPTQDETDAAHLAFVFNNVLAGTQTPQLYTESVHAGVSTPCGSVPVTTVIDDFKERFPNFDEQLVDTYLPPLIQTYCSYYSKPYTGCTKEATLQLLAHLFVIDTSPSSATSQVQSSKSVKNVSVSYEGTYGKDGKDAFYNSTKYGQRFLILISNCYGGFFV